MEFYNYIIDNIYDCRLVYDRIGIGGGRVILIGDKAAPYGVATRIIFVYERGGGGVGIWWCLCDGYEWNMDIFILIWLW